MTKSNSPINSSDDDNDDDSNQKNGERQPISVEYVMERLRSISLDSNLSIDEIRLMASEIEVDFRKVLAGTESSYTDAAPKEDCCASDADSTESPSGKEMVLVAEKDLLSSRLFSDFSIHSILGDTGSVEADTVLLLNVDIRLIVFYAVKRIPLKDKGKLSMELLALTRLKHPHIVRYYQAWIENYIKTKCTPPGSPSEEPLTGNIECLFIQMEFCSRKLKDQDFSIEDGWKFFLQLLDAVHYMHSKNICHGDLSSNNVLLDAEGDSRIIDFGLAHFLDEQAEDEKTLADVDVNNEFDWDTSPKSEDVYRLGELIVYLFNPRLTPKSESQERINLLYERQLPKSLNEEYQVIKTALLSMTHADPDCRPSTADLLAIFETKRDLEEATNNFSLKLGQGGFGSVYQGKLKDGTDIAVKQLEGIGQGKKEFPAEVSIIGSIHHTYLVRLRGFCVEGSLRLLAYEYMANNPLDKWIFKKNEDRKLDWATRYNIAVGTAKGLAYLHEDCDVKIVHCDIKPENVLLDEHFRAKVSDFGLAKLMNREQSNVFTTMRGTRGYLAPEWITNYAISEKSDVYWRI